MGVSGRRLLRVQCSLKPLKYVYRAIGIGIYYALL